MHCHQSLSEVGVPALARSAPDTSSQRIIHQTCGRQEGVHGQGCQHQELPQRPPQRCPSPVEQDQGNLQGQGSSAAFRSCCQGFAHLLGKRVFLGQVVQVLDL
eukprot:3805923-Lingulodinium_polyedra.AAC.1